MKNRILYCFVLIWMMTFISFSQNYDTVKIKRLQKIYRNLEIKTIGKDDIKNSWIITDALYIRELFDRFVARNAIRIDGRKPTPEEIKEKAKEIYSGNVFVYLRKRFYDDELELIKFFTETKIIDGVDSSTYFFDPIYDFVFIKDALGDKMYSDLKSMFYASNDLTKDLFSANEHYQFDIRMHIFEPELMFWTTTSAENSKYLVSLFGKWGNDYILFPAWFLPDYVAGLKMTYMSHIGNNKYRKTYSLSLGTGIPTKKQPNLNLNQDQNRKRLFHTGSTFYFNLSVNPFTLISDKLDFLNADFEGFLTLTQLTTSDINVDYLSQFFTSRNYLTLMFKANDVFIIKDFGSFNGGLGLSTYDLLHFLYRPDENQLIDLEPKAKAKFKNSVLGEFGFKHEGALLSHSLTAQINYNVEERLGYGGIKIFIMLSKTIGLDFRYFTAFKFNIKPIPYYRESNYIVFSPIIRINY